MTKGVTVIGTESGRIVNATLRPPHPRPHPKKTMIIANRTGRPIRREDGMIRASTGIVNVSMGTSGIATITRITTIVMIVGRIFLIKKNMRSENGMFMMEKLACVQLRITIGIGRAEIIIVTIAGRMI